MRRLLSFLGIGGKDGYKTCRYRIDDFVSEETRFVQRAILDAARSTGDAFDEVVLLCTKKARDRWTADDVIAREIAPSARLVDVPDGKDTSELWAIFNAVAQELGGSSPEPGLCVHMDVTHGFRVQPLIGLAALDFVRSEWLRRRISAPPDVRITYGAMDAAGDDPDGCAPVWDISELLTAGRWNSALTAVLAYGRGDELETLTKSLGDRAAREARARGRPPEEQGAARDAAGAKLGGAVRRFTDDLCTGRLPFLFKESAPALARTLESDGVRELREKLPVLAPTLEWLQSRVASLQADSTVATEAGARATLAYARLCGDLQRFAEQAAALREALVTLFALRQPWPQALLDAGKKGLNQQRKKIDEAFGRLGADLEEGKEPEKQAAQTEAGGAAEILSLGYSVADLRNDVEHLAIRSAPRPAKKVIGALDEYTQAAMRFVDDAPAQ
jgi:hypothetical protein